MAHVIHLFTGLGESEFIGKNRTLVALGLEDCLLENGNQGFNDIALEVRKHFTKKPAAVVRGFFVGEEHETQDLEDGLVEGLQTEVHEQKKQIAVLGVGIDTILSLSQETASDNLAEDLNKIYLRLKSLIELDAAGQMSAMRARLMYFEKAITVIAVKLGVEPSETVDDTLKRIETKVDDATAAPVFSNLPDNIDLSNPPGDIHPVQTPVQGIVFDLGADVTKAVRAELDVNAYSVTDSKYLISVKLFTAEDSFLGNATAKHEDFDTAVAMLETGLGDKLFSTLPELTKPNSPAFEQILDNLDFSTTTQG
jgi:hypothetical protein